MHLSKHQVPYSIMKHESQCKKGDIWGEKEERDDEEEEEEVGEELAESKLINVGMKGRNVVAPCSFPWIDL